MSAGLLIALEGGPGSGTAAQALLLRQGLDGEGVPAELAQPGGDEPWLVPAGERPPEWPAVSRVAPFLFRMTEMADLWHHAVAPAVAAGSVVIVDRYRLTLLAHARARKLDPEWAAAVVAGLPAADLSIYLRSDPARQLDRLLRAGDPLRGWEAGVDTLHGAGLGGAFRAYQAIVARQFDALVGGGTLAVDADAEPAAVRRQVHAAVVAALEAAR